MSRPNGEPDYYLMLWPIEEVVDVNAIPEVKRTSGDLVRNDASGDVPRGSSLLDFLRDLHA